MTKFITRHIGFCAVCERDIKLNPAGKLVHHGYERPGDGVIHNDCPGVGRDPYERSHAILDALAQALVERAAGTRKALGRFERGEVNKFFHNVWDYSQGKNRLVEFIRGTTSDHAFRQATESLVFKLQRSVESDENEQKRLRKWISGWVLKPIRNIEEHERTIRGAADTKRAAVAVARTARGNEKQAEIDARVAKLRAEIVAVGEEGVRLAALAAREPSEPAAREKLGHDLKKLGLRLSKANRATDMRGMPRWSTLDTRAVDALIALQFLSWGEDIQFPQGKLTRVRALVAHFPGTRTPIG